MRLQDLLNQQQNKALEYPVQGRRGTSRQGIIGEQGRFFNKMRWIRTWFYNWQWLN